MEERVVRNDEVVGSIPIGSTSLRALQSEERRRTPCCRTLREFPLPRLGVSFWLGW